MIVWIWSHHLHLQWNSNYWREILLEVIRQNIAGWFQQIFWFKSLLTMPSNVLPLQLKQIFPPIIWIFTEGKGDGFESRLPLKMFSTLTAYRVYIYTVLISLGMEEKRKKRKVLPNQYYWEAFFCFVCMCTLPPT